MKRYGYLMDRIVDRSNLQLAFHKASRGLRQRETVRRFRSQLDMELSALSTGARSGDLPLGQFTRFVVRDPKVRVIHAAPFQERVLHHAIMNVCGPLLERGAIDQSFACRKGRGNRAALVCARAYARQFRWYLKLDIRKYFDSICQERLKTRYSRLFKDPELLRLLDRIIDSYHSRPGQGLPIGTLTSQYLANYYLDPLDRFVKEFLRCEGYVRFMDDFVLWNDDPRQLQVWWDAIHSWLASDLGLEVKPGGQIGLTREGMPFLGFRVLPQAILMSRRGRKRFVQSKVRLECDWARGRVATTELIHRARALVAHTNQSHCRKWRRRVLGVSNMISQCVDEFA